VAGHQAKIYHEEFGYEESDLPISNHLASQGLALPLYSDLTYGNISMITSALRKTIK
jgi:dTDP-4-amino-4,6-dideoxygalactose transaminase